MALQTQTAVTVSAQPKTITLADLKKKYREGLAVAKRLQIEAQYLAQFGSEKKYLSQFKRMPYDAEAP